ncbi:SRPBCC family protein [Granulicella cerasi]|uniref:SRPBCC family protein n=1 Tax=Granulicella cerasi TaxID=741063 RepID=A0ABW1ZES4_9BACT|nr:SRPBCC family protein [Granulicella cerasi]
MPQHFHAEQWLPYPVELVFAFFANPENLPRLMPAWQKVRIEEAMFQAPPPRPEGTPRFPGAVAGSGSRILISARIAPWLPPRAGWDARIEDFRWNEGFCDVQYTGPFKSWRHCHTVTARDNDKGMPGTLVTDEVTYEPPFGELGVLAAKPALHYAWRIRHERTAALLARATTNAR